MTLTHLHLFVIESLQKFIDFFSPLADQSGAKQKGRSIGGSGLMLDWLPVIAALG